MRNRCAICGSGGILYRSAALAVTYDRIPEDEALREHNAVVDEDMGRTRYLAVTVQPGESTRDAFCSVCLRRALQQCLRQHWPGEEGRR